MLFSSRRRSSPRRLSKGPLPARRTVFRPCVEPLEDRTLLSAYLVKDINRNTVSSNPANLVNVNGTLFFSATDNDGSTGLWKSNGSAAGTTLVEEFTSGLGNFSNVNGALFFDVTDNSFGGRSELWQSDGTAAGTRLIKDFGKLGDFLQSTASVFDNELYFVVENVSTFQSGLWKSDGTTTVQVDPGAFHDPFGFTLFNGWLYFGASDTVNVTKLWKTDGSDANTQIADGDVTAQWVTGLSNANGALYFFAAADPSSGTAELYRSDGTDTTPVQTGLSGFGGGELAAAGGKLFFTAATASQFYPPQLWVSDGTAAGTRELQPANVSPNGLNPFFLQSVNGRVVFNGASVAHPNPDEGLWASDGTDAGTVEITPPALAGGLVRLGATASSGSSLYFGTVDQLWQTNGTAAGTTLVATINTPAAFAFQNIPDNLTLVGSTLFFTINDGTHGDELWKSNGSAAGTQLVKDINTNTIGSFPLALTDANGTLFFTADDSPAAGINPGPEIWKSDGTAAGTQLVGMPFASTLDFPANLTNVNGTVFFTAGNSPQLWRTDGTPGGTILLEDFSTLGVPSGFGPDNLTAVGNKLIFTIILPSDNPPFYEDEQLWESDGTPGGTVLVKDDIPSVAESGVAAGGKFFFIGVDPNTFADELWESGGTDAGTHVVDPANPGANVAGLTNVNGTLYYFDQGANFNDLTLWKTDGTTATEVADLSHGTDSLSAFNPIDVNGTLDFFVSDFSTGTSELWTSNGTPGGTVPLAAVQPDFGFNSVVAVGNRLFFTATDPVAGEQLWVSDGTAAGTHAVSGITAGTGRFGTLPFNLTAFDGKMFFTQSDPAHGEELWESDGTAAGTFLVQDINPGPANSFYNVAFNIGPLVPSLDSHSRSST